MKNLQQELLFEKLRYETRRHFLKQCTTGLGMMAMGSFLQSCGSTPQNTVASAANPLAPKMPHFAGKAKSVIYLHMAGAPSQLELFDYKPDLMKLDGKDCPPSFLEGKKFAFIRGVPQMMGPQAQFQQVGQGGAWVSDKMPYLQSVADDISFIKAMYTDQFNHAPAQLLLHTGSARLGRPSTGTWATYGLGSENQNLPGYMVLTSGGKNPDGGKALWGSGFLPSVYQGVQCRNQGEPVLYISDPAGMSRDLRKSTIDAITEINKESYEEFHDPETLARISQYEMAFRMQTTVPEVMDITKEPAYIHEMYGTQLGKESFANNCLLARKLVEQGVRFVQLFDWGWDSHGGGSEDSDVANGLTKKCSTVDKAITALIQDLKQRGLLDETLIVWGAEFGRTPMAENREGKAAAFKGRDHHTEAFTVWMAGGGIKGGYSHGETDPVGYVGIKDRTSVFDLQATIMHCLGFNHEEFTYPFQGRNFRLTDTSGKVIHAVLS
ncbi:DUF1501 domain-containing protein [Flectobacillus sp. DC10W]|uniref:DUF1501 domain-containing protein n=1 Tax=Flectobacillus longus TaxID=2984207 RepID=A0ABT6YQ78_9BACT|nr:DUF1501 domain-containing protein [Flectobacillus longus]MDI9865303.1 DUF1501 domain-containing protein [Flectobacillus longus]